MDQGKSEKGGFSRVIGKIAGRKPPPPPHQAILTKPQETPPQVVIEVKTPEREYYEGRKFPQEQREFLEKHGFRIYRLHGLTTEEIKATGKKIAKRPVGWEKGMSTNSDIKRPEEKSNKSEVAVLVGGTSYEFELGSIEKRYKSSNRDRYRGSGGGKRPTGFSYNIMEAVFEELDSLEKKLNTAMRGKGVEKGKEWKGTPQVKVVNGNVADYGELFFAHKDATGKDLFRNPVLTSTSISSYLGYGPKEPISHNLLISLNSDGEINPYGMQQANHLSPSSIPDILPLVMPRGY